MDICTSLQRQHSLIEERIQSQDLKITQLKTRIKSLKDNETRREGVAQEDAPNMGGWIKGSSLRAADILASGGLRSAFTTTSLSVATASTCISPAVATASGSFPTAAIFTTASVATPTTRVTRSSRGVVIGSSSPITVLEQLSIRLARDLEAKFAQKDLIIREQAKRDFEIARIHAEKELEMMIAELDRSNEMVAKYLSEYEQAAIRLSHDEKVELINKLLMYQRHLAQIKKYQAQQNKPATKTEKRYFYMSILRSNAGWKAKDFKGMTFKQIEERFIPVWEKMQDFVPMNSKLESERLKRPRIQLDKERSKKLKTTEASGTEPTQEQHTTEVTDEKAKELWVELKRLYEPDSRDPLWALERLSVPTTNVYIAKRLATVEDFALLHEDKIYSESKTRVCYIYNVVCDYSINLGEFVRTYLVHDYFAYKRNP
nr:hypothetical protein [Tanacetum cinerariifolium]